MKPLSEQPIGWLRTGTIAVAFTCGLVCAVRGADLNEAAASIPADDLMRHIRPLASDEFAGRAPRTKGEQLTAGYITDEFPRMGLKHGIPDGIYVQRLPFDGCTAPAYI